jgi:beta-glucosidase
MNQTTGAFNSSGLVANMEEKAGSFYGNPQLNLFASRPTPANDENVLQIVGYPISWEMLTSNIQKGQDYLIHNTTLGIPALVQTEGIHGFLIGNATIFNSPIGYGSSWNRDVRNHPKY